MGSGTAWCNEWRDVTGGSWLRQVELVEPTGGPFVEYHMLLWPFPTFLLLRLATPLPPQRKRFSCSSR